MKAKTAKGILENLAGAYEMEKGVGKFYRKAAGAAHEEAARAAFLELALSEDQQAEYIRYAYGTLKNGREITGFEDFRRLKPEFPEPQIPVSRIEPESDYNFTDELGAILSALETEAGEYGYYRDLHDNETDPRLKSLYAEFMRWEDAHVEVLKALRLRIEETS